MSISLRLRLAKQIWKPIRRQNRKWIKSLSRWGGNTQIFRKPSIRPNERMWTHWESLLSRILLKAQRLSDSNLLSHPKSKPFGSRLPSSRMNTIRSWPAKLRSSNVWRRPTSNKFEKRSRRLPMTKARVKTTTRAISQKWEMLSSPFRLKMQNLEVRSNARMPTSAKCTI